MNNTQQKQLGSALWGIADKLRGTMNADDFRDYMFFFLDIFQTIMKLRQIRSLAKTIQIVRKKLKT